MSLTKISGFWYTELTDEHGVGVRRATGQKVGSEAARKEAERIHKERKLEIDAKKLAHRKAGSPGKQITMTLNEATGKFFAECEDLASPDKALQQRAGEVEAGIERLCKGLGYSKRLDEIAAPAILAYRNIRAKTITRRGNLIAPATVNYDTKLLRRVMRYAGFAWGVILGAPIEWGELMLEEGNKRKRYLSREEEKRLFDNLRWDFHPMVKFALMTGMRAANVWGLKWEHVDFELNQINVMQKGKREFTQALSPALRQHILAEKGNHDTFVFTYVARHPRRNRKAGLRYPFTKTGWSKPWRAALADAKIKNFRFHDNRHTAATRVVSKTQHLPTAMEFLGHANIQSTMRYAHLIDGAVRKAATDMHAEYYPNSYPKNSQAVGKKG